MAVHLLRLGARRGPLKVLYGCDELVTSWVLKHIPHVDNFGPCKALAVTDRDRPIAGVVFHDYQPQYKTMQISMAADSPRWAKRGIIRELLGYPFNQLGVQKVWTATPSKNERAIRFNNGIGLLQDAVLTRHFGADDAVICRMFFEEYQTLFTGVSISGEIESKTTSGTRPS